MKGILKASFVEAIVYLLIINVWQLVFYKEIDWITSLTITGVLFSFLVGMNYTAIYVMKDKEEES